MRHFLFFGAACAVMWIATTGQARAGIINGGFETGDLTGWSASSSSLVSVISSTTYIGLQAGPGDSSPWNAVEGTQFAYLRSGAGADTYTLLSQQFSVGIGDSLSLSVFFDGGDWYSQDTGYVRLINKSTSEGQFLFRKQVSDVGSFGGTDWTLVSHTFASAGTYEIVAGVKNGRDNNLDSALGIDAVELDSAATVPEPSGLAIFAGLGAMGLIAARRRKAS